MMWCPDYRALILLACAACSGAPSARQAASNVAVGAQTSQMFDDPQGIAKSRDQLQPAAPEAGANAPTVPADVLDRLDHPPGDAGVDATP